MEGDPAVVGDAAEIFRISIHSLRMEGDGAAFRSCTGASDFNPLPPHGGRRGIFTKDRAKNHFNPLPPHGGRQAGSQRLSLQ